MKHEELVAIFQHVTQQTNLNADTPLESINGWDSMAVLGLMAAIDREFGVSIDPTTLGLCERIADVAEIVSSHLSPGDAP